ncbi:hypothetical protein [Homoserinimonas hongtaonis]|uniref:hypothetical protein n=1 Tax=Homoserinimonas hongtaonis TaxID=2079791 RepID=UPI000D39AECE|nr:hypothetical protein [Salinibacterium hongtaonis]AWB88972.1 hypothetical protein C2138_04930 [Salinibacterium hongtaonis]
MPRSTSTARTNIPLIVLWAASIAVVVIGYLVTTMAITAQTDLYGAGSQDVQALLNGQAGVTMGTTLLGVGVLGILLALAVHARNAAERVRPVANGYDDDLDLDREDEPGRPAAHAASTHVATNRSTGPASATGSASATGEQVPVAPGAVEPTVPPSVAPAAPPAGSTPAADETPPADPGATPPPRP